MPLHEPRYRVEVPLTVATAADAEMRPPVGSVHLVMREVALVELMPVSALRPSLARSLLYFGQSSAQVLQAIRHKTASKATVRTNLLPEKVLQQRAGVMTLSLRIFRSRELVPKTAGVPKRRSKPTAN